VLENTPAAFEANVFTDSEVTKCFDNRFIITPIGEVYDELIQSADLAFTTAGTSSFELIAQGIPIGIGCAVKNQEQYYTQLSDLDLAAPIGKFENGEWKLDSETVSNLVNSEELRRRLISKSTGLIDFGGAKRIVEEILQL
jgi:spore coat polysaccharide biosynthesis predicted glycosyltransferase SpsG